MQEKGKRQPLQRRERITPLPPTTPAASARRWADYRHILSASPAGQAELARFDRVTRRDFLSAVGRGAALALVLFGAGPQAAARGLCGRRLLPSAGENIPDQGLPKPDMIVHSEDPFNGELPVHLLDDAVTPTARHFVRNNGAIPERARSKDLHGWALRVDGEVRHELALTLEDLLCFPQVTMQTVLECAGNGRSLFHPPVGGTQWIRGAVACSEWTGARLRDVLESAGVKDNAVYAACYGEDAAPDGGEPFSRGIPLAKALDEHTLVALALNGVPLPAAHGFPARLLVPGWIGSSMQKWLTRIRLRDRVLVSTDFGISWRETSLTAPANRYAWYHWSSELVFRQRGYYEIWARAFDDAGNAQPFRQPWNPKGYLGNVIHRFPLWWRRKSAA